MMQIRNVDFFISSLNDLEKLKKLHRNPLENVRYFVMQGICFHFGPIASLGEVYQTS